MFAYDLETKDQEERKGLDLAGRSDELTSKDHANQFKAHTVVNYIANNNNDQQYFERLSNFLE